MVVVTREGLSGLGLDNLTSAARASLSSRRRRSSSCWLDPPRANAPAPIKDRDYKLTVTF